VLRWHRARWRWHGGCDGKKESGMNASGCRIIGLLIVLIAPANSWAQLLATLNGHSKTVTSVSYSSDGGSIVSGSWDHSVRIWDAGTYQPVATLSGHTAAVTSVSYSPDGKSIASASRDYSIRIWDARRYQHIGTLVGHTGTVTCVAYSPDGSMIVSSGEDQAIKVWDAQSYELLSSLTGHSGIVYSVAYSPNGKSFISAGWDGAINVWNAKTYKVIKTLSGQLSVIYSAAYSRDGKWIIGGRGDGSISIWNAQNYRIAQTLKGHSGTVSSVSSHPQGRYIIAGHGDGSINIWDARTFQLSKTLNGHSGTVATVSFSPNGEEIVSGSGDYLVNIWDFFPMLAKTGSPPDLYAEISFSEQNGNGYLDADEVGNLHLKLTNKGRGDALNLKLAMTLAEANPHLLFENRSLRHLKAGESRDFDVALLGGLEVRTGLNALKIEVTEQQGHHMDPLEFAFYTQSLAVPRFALLGVEIDDDDEADSFGQPADGMVQAAEQIEARVSIQNQGAGESPGDAQEVEVRLINRSPSIQVLSEERFFKRRLKLGEVFAFDVIFTVDEAYPVAEPLLPLEFEIVEKYGIAAVSGLSLGIELGKRPITRPPMVVARKPVRLGRAKFDRLGSKTTVVYEQRPMADPVSNVGEVVAKRANALGVIIGMPEVPSAVRDADLMRRYFRHALGIRDSDIKVYAQGMSRNDLVTLFEQKMGHAVGAETEVFVFYSGPGIVDAENAGHLLPADGSRVRALAAPTCYSLADLYAAINVLNAKSKTVILDICFLSTDLERDPLPVMGAGDGGDDNLTVISYATGTRGQRIVQGPEQGSEPGSGHGLFTHVLAAGLKGGADHDNDSKVTLAEMKQYVEDQVIAGNGGAHSPTFWTSDGNYDVVFAEVAPRTGNH